MKPSSLTTFTEATFTPGATPAMPTPLMAAAMVPATCVPCAEVVGLHAASSRVDDAADARGALVLRDLRREVGVRGVDAGVEHAHHDRRVAGGDGVRGRHIDLHHVPLRAPQGLGRRVAGGLDRGGVDRLDDLVVDEGGAEALRRGDGFDSAAGDGTGERGVRRPCDEHADLVVGGHHGAAGGRDARRRLGGALALRREHEVAGLRPGGRCRGYDSHPRSCRWRGRRPKPRRSSWFSSSVSPLMRSGCTAGQVDRRTGLSIRLRRCTAVMGRATGGATLTPGGRFPSALPAERDSRRRRALWPRSAKCDSNSTACGINRLEC